jgi:hypothetical protein
MSYDQVLLLEGQIFRPKNLIPVVIYYVDREREREREREVFILTIHKGIVSLGVAISLGHLDNLDQEEK